MRIIKQYIGEFFTVIGIGIFIFGLLNFAYTPKIGGTLPPISTTWGDGNIYTLAYYYPPTFQYLITLGAVLFTLGFLVIKNKYKNCKV